MNVLVVKKAIKWLVYLTAVVVVIAMMSIPFALLKSEQALVNGDYAKRMLLKNAKLLDPYSNKLLNDYVIVIEDGVIQEITTEEVVFDETGYDEVATNAQQLIIDVDGQVIMPGLTDMHVHLYDRSDLLLNLAYGVTQVRNMHGSELQLNLREEVTSGQSIGPDIIVSSPIVNQHSRYANSDFHWFAENTEDAKQLVRYFYEQGYDLIKIYDGLQPEIFSAVVEEAKHLNMPVAGHPSFFIGVEGFLSANTQTVEHVEMLYQAYLNYSKDSAALAELVATLKSHEIAITSTLIVFDNLVEIAKRKQEFIDELPLDYMHPLIYRLFKPGMYSIMDIDDADQWAAKSDYLGKITHAINQYDVPLVLGSDAGAGFTLNGMATIDEMQLLEEHNISSVAILRSATSAAAKALKQSANNGRLAVGYKANLVILDNDPRIDLNTFNRVQGVIKDQVYYNQSAINEMKQLAKQHMSYYEFLGWILLDQWQRLSWR